MSANPSQVLIVSCCQGMGWGAEEVLEHYLRAGGCVSIAAPASSRFSSLSAELGFPFTPLDIKKNKFISHVASGLKVRIEPSPSLVHSWCARSVETAWILSKRYGAQLSVGLHDSPDQEYHSAARGFIIKKICRQAASVVTVSEAMAKKCLNLGLSDDIHVIRNGIPVKPPVARRQNKSVFTVGFLGMNVARKGFRTLIDWIDRSDWLWRLYGDVAPELDKEVNTLLDRHNGRLHICGRVNSSLAYSEVDVVVIPSLTFEAFGLVAVEAGRAGLPVVASEIGGLKEIIFNGENGFLYPVSDPEAGFNALLQLSNNFELRKIMGDRGRAIFEHHFTSERMKKDWDSYLGLQL